MSIPESMTDYLKLTDAQKMYLAVPVAAKRCGYCDTEHPEDQIGDPFFCIARLMERVKLLEDEIRQTLEENRHLADGDNCTLWRLKQAIGKE